MRKAALIALVLAACGEADPYLPDAGGGGSVTLTLGTVDAAGAGFVPLAGDQPLIPGAQGGFHVWVKYRVSGHQAGPVRIKRTARRVSDNRLVLLTESAQDLGEPSADGYWEVPAAMPSFMCPSPIGVRVVDERLRFIVELFHPDTGELLGQGQAEATPRCPDDAQHEWCMRICVG
jgi:hypothetical protein